MRVIIVLISELGIKWTDNAQRTQLFSRSVISHSCNSMGCGTPGLPVLHYLPEFAQAHVHWVSDAIQPSHLLSPPSPPAFNLSASGAFPVSRLFTSGGHIRSFSFSPYNDYSGLIYFKIDWFDGLDVQGTLKSLLQHYSSKASIIQCSAFFMTQLSHPVMTTAKTIALTIQMFLFLGSTYKWVHTVSLCLTFSTFHNALKFYPHCGKW